MGQNVLIISINGYSFMEGNEFSSHFHIFMETGVLEENHPPAASQSHTTLCGKVGH